MAILILATNAVRGKWRSWCLV